MDSSQRTKNLLTLFFLLCIGSLAILKISDPDAWLHLSLGRLIWNLRGLPVHEQYIPALNGAPFSYSSWLFGVLYYAAYDFFGAAGVTLLKAFTVIAIFAILLRDASSPYRRDMLAVSVLIVIAVCIRGRFVERPDTFLMMFLPYSIMALNIYLQENNKRYLYTLPLVHMLWANSHSSINLMFVPFAALLAAAGISLLLKNSNVINRQRLTGPQTRVILITLIASVAGALITPYGVGQFTFGAQFLHTDVFKQEITELTPTNWSFGLRWFYILVTITALSCVAAWRRMLLSDLIRILPFVYLGFLSRRFTYVFAVVAAPILIRNLSQVYEQRFSTARPEKRSTRIIGISLGYCWVAAWTATSLFQIPPFNNHLASGFGFDLSNQPEGALAYMDRRNITGRIFNCFSWGQYIEWRDFPRRIPFIDGRAYLPKQLLEPYFTENWQEMARDYDTDAFLVDFPRVRTNEGTAERDLGLGIPGWALVYWDDTSLVYLKQGGRYHAVIAQDRYISIKPANGVEGIETAVRDPLKRDGIIAELQRNMRETGSSRAKYLLGKVYMETGNYQQAIKNWQTISNGSSSFYNDMGRCYELVGNVPMALHCYQKSLGISTNSTAHFSIGSLLLKTGDASGAVKHLKLSITLSKSNTKAYEMLISAYQKLGNTDEASKATKEYQKNLKQNKAEEYFNRGVKAYMDQEYAGAIAAFEQSIATDPEKAIPYANLGFVQFDIKQPDQAFASFQQALRRDANCSIAHYGIALIYQMQGDAAAATTHLKRYLELEPTGTFSRQVKRYLEKKS